MLSYRHGFHAGNFADVLKHVVLVAILQYLKKKESPFYYHDSHAGAGSYRITHTWMQKNREYREGIGRLWLARPKSPLLNDYLRLIRALNPSAELAIYPGSPALALQLLRAHDRAWFGERHTSDFRILSGHFGERPGVQCEMLDAWQGLKAKLPPKERRGLILIDPSYEMDSDYRLISRSLEEALRRFAQGIYALWYPVLQQYTADKLLARLATLPARDKLHVRIDTGEEGPGMHGCGMVILNPPFTLSDTLKQTLPELTGLLEHAKGTGQYRIEPLYPAA